MAVLSKGTTFATGEQVTATKLNNLVDSSTFASGAVDNVSTQLSSGAIIVKDGGISTAKIVDSNVTTAKIADSNVTKAKIENVADMKVLGNTSGSAAAPQEVSVLDEDDMTSDSATALATQQSIKAYVDLYKPNVALASKLDTQVTASGENVWNEVTGLNPSLTTRVSGSSFRVSASMSWCATSQGYGVAWKVMYSLNGGSYTDFSLPTSPGNKVAVHAVGFDGDVGSWLDKNTFDVFLTGLSYSAGDTVAFKIYTQQVAGTGSVYINRAEVEVDNNDYVRGISTLQAEEIYA